MWMRATVWMAIPRCTSRAVSRTKRHATISVCTASLNSVHELLEAGAPTSTKNHAGQRPVDTIVGARAESELGKKCIEMLTMSQAEAQLDAADIAYGTYPD